MRRAQKTMRDNVLVHKECQQHDKGRVHKNRENLPGKENKHMMRINGGNRNAGRRRDVPAQSNEIMWLL